MLFLRDAIPEVSDGFSETFCTERARVGEAIGHRLLLNFA